MSTVIPRITIEEVGLDERNKHEDCAAVTNKVVEEAVKKRRKAKPKQEHVIDNSNLLSPNQLPEDAAHAKMQQWYVDLAVLSNLNETLPKMFTVKYIGRCPAYGLWGIQYTRKPVQKLVDIKRAFPNGPLPVQNFEITEAGVTITPARQNKNSTYLECCIPIHLVSYGVQDSVYQRIFAMIVIRETTDIKDSSPFELFGFVCDSTEAVQNLTRALALAFKLFSDAEDVMDAAYKNKNRKHLDELNGFINCALAMDAISEA